MTKYSFGDYSIIGSVTHTFQKAPQWWWKIKPVTSGDELEITNFIYRNRDIEDANGKVRYIPPANLEIAHREIAILFDGTNIPEDPDRPVEEGGKPIIEAGWPDEKIEQVLRQMPAAMVLEIWKAIGDANPEGRWGPDLPKPKGEQTPENSG